MDVVKTHQYEVYWISLDPTQGNEMSKTRPCVVVSPDEMNEFLQTLTIIPITSTVKGFPWRIDCPVSNKKGSVATDQMKVIDKIRIGSKIARLSKEEILFLKGALQKMLID